MPTHIMAELYQVCFTLSLQWSINFSFGDILVIFPFILLTQLDTVECLSARN